MAWTSRQHLLSASAIGKATTPRSLSRPPNLAPLRPGQLARPRLHLARTHDAGPAPANGLRRRPPGWARAPPSPSPTDIYVPTSTALLRIREPRPGRCPRTRRRAGERRLGGTLSPPPFPPSTSPRWMATAARPGPVYRSESLREREGKSQTPKKKREEKKRKGNKPS